MDTFGLLALACSAALGYFFYRVVWTTRDAGPFPVRRIPIVGQGD